MTSLIKDAVTVLHNRLKTLTPDSTPEQLAYLAKSLESLGGQATLLDIVALSDEKLIEIADSVLEYQTELTVAKDNHLLALEQAKNTHVSNLGDVVSSQVASINELVAVNDVPNGSTIMQEITNKPDKALFVEDSLPFLFGVLSRSAEHYGTGNFTTDLGQWHTDISNTHHMLALLAGCHAYKNQYNAFRLPPQLQFLQGAEGSYSFNQLVELYSFNPNQYNYPHAVLGVLFVKNTTHNDITSNLSFGGACRWASGFEGAGLFLGVPDGDNTNTATISAIDWTNLYNLNSNNNNYAASATITFPADKTSALLLYNSAWHSNTTYNRYTQFLHWRMEDVRTNLLTAGLEIDKERTQRAWQSPGLSSIHQIWQ